MKHISKKVMWPVLFLCFIATSCNKFSIDISHRKYRPGFYVDISHKTQTNIAKEDHANEKINNLKSIELNQQQNLLPHLTALVPTPVPDQNVVRKINSGKSITASKSQVNKTEIVSSRHESHSKIIHANENSSNKNTSAFYLLGALAGLMSGGIFMSIRKRAVKISQWSARNVALSRGLQAVGHTVIGFGSFIAGSILFRHDFVTTPLASGIFTSVFLASAAMYPVNIRGKAVLQSLYNRTKLTDLAIVVSGALMCASLGNRVAQERLTASTDHAIAFTPAQNLFSGISSRADNINSALFKVDATEGEKLSTGQIILLILIPIVFFILTLGVILASCALQCTGNTALAPLALVLGLALLIYLSILSVKGVKKMKGKRRPAILDQK